MWYPFKRPAPPRHAIIDLSEDNGMPGWQPIDWKALLASHPHIAGQPVEGAYVRIGHGQTLDRAFRENWAALRNSFWYQGIYLYCEPGTSPTVSAHAHAQMDWMWEQLLAVGGPHVDDLTPALDVEEGKGLTAAELRLWTRAARNHLQTLSGQRPRLYSSQWWFQSVFKPLIREGPNWIAAYGQFAAPPMPHDMWQWGQVSLPGVTANVVDANWMTAPLPF